MSDHRMSIDEKTDEKLGAGPKRKQGAVAWEIDESITSNVKIDPS